MAEQLAVRIEGMTCGHCVKAVEGALKAMAGVDSSDVVIGSATVVYDPDVVGAGAILGAIADEGYPAVAVAAS